MEKPEFYEGTIKRQASKSRKAKEGTISRVNCHSRPWFFWRLYFDIRLKIWWRTSDTSLFFFPVPFSAVFLFFLSQFFLRESAENCKLRPFCLEKDDERWRIFFQSPAVSVSVLFFILKQYLRTLRVRARFLFPLIPPKNFPRRQWITSSWEKGASIILAGDSNGKDLSYASEPRMVDLQTCRTTDWGKKDLSQERN